MPSKEGASRAMTPVLEVRNLEKSFGGVPVLRDVSMHVEAGQVVALAGENGAGKSTVMKIVTGQVQLDCGRGHHRRGPVGHNDTQVARSLGVAIVPQELAPYPDLTVYENLFVGRELRNKVGMLDRRAMAAKAKQMLEVFEVDIDPSTLMNRLSVSVTQLVEIAKATTWGAKILLLDEPTSAIPDREVDRLYGVVRKLRAQGVAMIYTTHRMAEIQQLADRVVVLRDGRLVMDAPLGEAPEHAIVRAMIGRDLDSLFPDKVEPRHEIGLSVSGLQVERGGPTVSLEVRRGEILGLGGLVGAGRTEIAEGIFGIRESHAGDILVGDTPIKRNSTHARHRRRRRPRPGGPQGRGPRAAPVGPRQHEPSAHRVLQHRRLDPCA